MDPVFGWIARLGLALLFGAALAHKLRDPDGFAATVRDYRMLPARLSAATAKPIALALAAAEAATAVLLAVPAVDPAGPTLALLLLALYGAAIGTNLARGRRDIDCGCLGPAHRQPLSGWLLVRNGVLGLAAAALFAGDTARALGWVDAVSVVAAVAMLALLWHAVNELSSAGSRPLDGRLA